MMIRNVWFHVLHLILLNSFSPTTFSSFASANQIVGVSYCSWGPDFDCYENGHPPCCTDSTPCPPMRTECDKNFGCASENSGLFQCFATNDCLATCSPILAEAHHMIEDIGCDGNDNLCFADACCGTCSQEVDKVRSCNYGSECGECNNIGESEVNKFLSEISEFSNEDKCHEEMNTVTACINFSGCDDSCMMFLHAMDGPEDGDDDPDDNSFAPSCGHIPFLCEFSRCCEICSSFVDEALECIYTEQCGETDCDNVEGVTIPPAFYEDFVGEDDFNAGNNDNGFSEQCSAVGFAYMTCLMSNFDCLLGGQCEAMMDDDNAEEEFSCDSVSEACEMMSCCSACQSVGAAVINCEAMEKGCSEQCAGDGGAGDGDDGGEPTPSPVTVFTLAPIMSGNSGSGNMGTKSGKKGKKSNAKASVSASKKEKAVRKIRA